jgi:hypothetical protein
MKIGDIIFKGFCGALILGASILHGYAPVKHLKDRIGQSVKYFSRSSEFDIDLPERNVEITFYEKEESGKDWNLYPIALTVFTLGMRADTTQIDSIYLCGRGNDSRQTTWRRGFATPNLYKILVARLSKE